MKIILFPEITLFKNKWLLNFSKNIIKELVSRKRLLLFIRLQAHGGCSRISSFISLTIQWEKKNPKVFLLAWFLILHKGFFKVVWSE